MALSNALQRFPKLHAWAADTRRKKPEEIEAERKAAAAFYAAKPQDNERCKPCGIAAWGVHLDGNGARIWACNLCDRPPLSDAEWYAECEAKRADEAAQAKEAASESTPSATRAALVNAIERHREAEKEFATLRDRAAGIDGAVIDAMYARDAATTALAAAETPNAETLTTTGSPTPRKTPRQARADLEEAEDAYRQARRTRDALDELVASKGSTVEFKRELMEAAAAAAVRAHSSAEIDAFVAGTERMQAELHERIAALEWLLRAGIIDKTDVVRRITERFHSPVPEWRLPPVSNIVLRMGAQIAELCRNPKASAKLLS